MDTSNWIALSALLVSLGTASRGEVVSVGYHLVLWNRGPARATAVDVSVHFVDGNAEEQLRLTDAADGEFPLAQLDAGARYPVPWALGEDGLARKDERRFVLTLTWQDSKARTLRVPVRRGNAGAPTIR